MFDGWYNVRTQSSLVMSNEGIRQPLNSAAHHTELQMNTAYPPDRSDNCLHTDMLDKHIA